MRKIFSIAIIAALMASPVSANEPSQPKGQPIVPCKVVDTTSEKEAKIAIRKMKRQGFQVTVTRKGQTKMITKGGDPFPFALAQANVVKSGC